MSNSNGRTPRPRREPQPFPEGYRRIVPGETTQEGDLMRENVSGEWIAAPVGVEVRASLNQLLARPRDVPVEEAVALRAMARFSLFVIENAYRLENMVTGNLSQENCSRCGGEGEPDLDMLWCDCESLYHDGQITQQQFEELEDLEDEDFVERFEEICEENGLEQEYVPMRYDHDPDCEGWWMRNLLGDFQDVFSNYIESNGHHLHGAAKLEGDDETWL